jgi:hypothetical protein
VILGQGCKATSGMSSCELWYDCGVTIRVVRFVW